MFTVLFHKDTEQFHECASNDSDSKYHHCAIVLFALITLHFSYIFIKLHILECYFLKRYFKANSQCTNKQKAYSCCCVLF